MISDSPALGLDCSFCLHSKCHECVEHSSSILSCCHCRARAISRLSYLQEISSKSEDAQAGKSYHSLSEKFVLMLIIQTQLQEFQLALGGANRSSPRRDIADNNLASEEYNLRVRCPFGRKRFVLIISIYNPHSINPYGYWALCRR